MCPSQCVQQPRKMLGLLYFLLIETEITFTNPWKTGIGKHCNAFPMPSHVPTLHVKVHTFDFLEDTTFPFFSKPYHFPGKNINVCIFQTLLLLVDGFRLCCPNWLILNRIYCDSSWLKRSKPSPGKTTIRCSADQFTRELLSFTRLMCVLVSL